VAPENAIRKMLEKHQAKVISVDLNRGRLPGHGAVMADLHCLPFPNGCFSMIISLHVLTFVHDDQQCMRELHRVLAPNGYAILQEPLSDRKVTREFIEPRPDRDGQMREYGHDYFDRLRAIGFTSVAGWEYIGAFKKETT
jgi:ubiquinone/menaquinone biosynthesis C-methylase UbiE